MKNIQNAFSQFGFMLFTLGFLLFSFSLTSCQSSTTTSLSGEVKSGDTNPPKDGSGLSQNLAREMTPTDLSPSAAPKADNETSVMTFNVENMFDTIHDEGTEDYTYLPKSEKNRPEIQEYCKSLSNNNYKEDCFNKDWNVDIVKFKLAQVGKVIRHVEGGKGPDHILFAEVENINILGQLFKAELKDLGYQTVILTEGFDLRGIDVGFASKFPLAKGTSPILHRIKYSDPKASRSRGILEVTVELASKKPLTFLAAHFPSQANPSNWRKEAYDFTAELMKKYQDQGRAVIFGGDLNTTEDENKEFGFFSKTMSSVGQVSHLVGCKSCKGSHFYKGEWSFLDVLVFGNGLEKIGASLLRDSLSIVKAPAHLRPDGSPLRFNEEKMEGVSDHLPLYSRLKIIGKTTK